MHYKIVCWICFGKGWVQGPIHNAPCPNEFCPHKRVPKPLRKLSTEKAARDYEAGKTN